MRLGIIGGGRAAWAFGQSWTVAGRELSGIHLRPDSTSPVPELLRVRTVALEALLSSSDAILVAVPDQHLPRLASQLAGAPAELALFHPSGSLSSALFSPHPVRFSLHPLRALPRPGESALLRGAVLTFEGTPPSREVAERFAVTFEGRLMEIAVSEKTLYHAAAVLGSNDVAVLLELATEMMERAGLESPELRSALADLARSAIGIWESGKDQTRFTGPVARGDDQTVGRHLEALAAIPEAAEIYRNLVEELRRILRKPAKPSPV